MNPYDAILEQLQKAQKRGVETVSNRLDFVLETLEAMINEAREAVKEAVPAEPDELFPVAECTRAVDEARASLETSEAQVAELTEKLQAAEEKIQELETRLAEAESRGGGALSLETLRRLDSARSQSELLKELLPSLLDHAGRAAVLVVREGRVSAWSGIGFSDGERLRSWNAVVAESPALEKLVHENAVVAFSPSEDRLFGTWLEGETVPSEAVIVPVVLRGRTVGGIYADRVPDAPWDVEAIQVMVAVACWLIDTLTFRSTVPSPPLGELASLAPPAAEGGSDEAGFAAAEETTPEYGYAPVAEAEEVGEEPAESGEEAVPQEPAPAVEVAPVEEPAEAVAAEVEETPAAEPEEFAEAQPDAGWSAEPSAPSTEPEPPQVSAETVEIPRGQEWTAPGEGETGAMESTVEPEAVAPEEPVAPPVEPPVPEPEESPAQPVEPPVPEEPVSPPPVEPVSPPAPAQEPPAQAAAPVPPPVAPVVPPPVSPVVPPPQESTPATEPSAEEDPRYEEARRFARLLVSEIKLYNPEEVERGRANNDIYQRLKEDIDRSREMYDKRVAEDVRAHRDFFREELVRILADGDEDALGM